MKKFRPLVPKGPIYADNINALAGEVMRLGNMDVDGTAGTSLENLSSGPHLTLPRPFFGIWARVSNPDNAAAPWAWRQVRPIENGQFADMIDSEGPREGFVTRDPLYPSDGQIVPNGAVRFIVKGCAHPDGASVQQDWLTLTPTSAGGGGGGGTCCETHISQLYCCLPRCISFFAAYIAGTGPVSVYGVYIWNRQQNVWAAASSCCGTNDNVFNPNPCQAVIKKGKINPQVGFNDPTADWLSIEIPRAGNPAMYFLAPSQDAPVTFSITQDLAPPSGCPNDPRVRFSQFYNFSPSSGFPDITKGAFMLLAN